MVWRITTRLHQHCCVSARWISSQSGDLKFPCWDIREWQLEKTVAYAWALQFWVEKTNLPTLGQPHILAGSVLELREVMKCYISFPDNAVFGGMALPEGSLTDQLETTAPRSAQPASTDSSVEEVATEEVTLPEKAATEEAATNGRPLVGPSTFQTPSEEPTRSPRSPEGDLVARVPDEGGHWWAEEQLQVQTTRSEPHITSWAALGGPSQGIQTMGPTIEDITNLP